MPRRRLPRRLLAGLLLTGLFAATGLLSRVWTPEVPGRLQIARRLKAPGVAGLLGTDNLGRDIASLLMAGAWNSLVMATLAVLLGATVGILLGTVAAAKQGWWDRLIAPAADLVFAFPAVISAVMIGALVGPGVLTVVLALGVFAAPVFLRITRAAARQVWATEYCLAAVALGRPAWRITLRHVLPGIAGVLAVQVTVQLGLAILGEAGLSFLGLGPAPPAPSLGRMLGEAQTFLGPAPWMALAPGVAIAFAVLGFTLLGDGLRDWLDPRPVAPGL